MAEDSESLKLLKRLQGSVWAAVQDFKMIVPGDKVMVCLSGGKDSYTMLDMLMKMQKSPTVDFEIIAVNLDQKQPDFPEHILPEYLSKVGVPFKIVERDTYSIVKEKIPEGKTMCSLCSRMRRGTLYTVAEELGATKIALGHHREDIIETMFLNLFFNGKMEAMPAKYKTDDGKHIVIRPLAYCKEKDISEYSKEMEFPIIPCNLCGSQENMQRRNVKNMLKKWDEENPGRVESIFNAMQNIHPSHMLDRGIFDFHSLLSESMKTQGIKIEA
ncbi:MAG: tRNA 2-thiocytidine(32) synthetase TtcA [Bacteroidetes bacterium]|nr:tRNA 2-thiocytidine(32) synthetase TtcA [Bacteroidota bacterium]